MATIVKTNYESGGLLYELYEDTIDKKITRTAKISACSDDTNENASVIKIPNTIEYEHNKYIISGLKETPFTKCKKLKVFRVESDADAFSTTNGVLYSKDKKILYCYPIKKEETSFTVSDSTTTIYGQAFHYNGYLKSISLNKITNISYYAFQHCTGLENIIIPSTVTSIGIGAFDQCFNLTSCTFATGAKLTKISGLAFKDCISLKEITIPDSVETIGSQAFKNCISLETIQIPFVGGMKNIVFTDDFPKPEGWSDKDNRSSLPESLFGYIFNHNTDTNYENPNIIKQGLTKVEQIYSMDLSKDSQTFPYYVPSSLKKVIISGNLSRHGVMSKIPIQSVQLTGASIIGSSAFSGCKNLTSVSLNSGITKIYYYAFNGCSNLEKITIPNTVIHIGQGAFKNTSLTEIKLPLIGTGETTSPQTYKNHFGFIFDFTSSTTRPSKYQLEVNGKYYNYSIPKQLTKVIVTKGEIPHYGFQKCETIKTIELSDSVTFIGECAFKECINLNSLNFPNNNDYISIKYATCYDCKSLTSIKIPNQITTVGYSSFCNCQSLKDIQLPQNLTKISGRAFENCYAFKTFEIPKTVSIIGCRAFLKCKYLTNIYFQEDSKLHKIEPAAFEGCEALTSLIIPPSVEIIGGDNSTVLTNDKNVEGQVFKGCSALKSISLPFPGQKKQTNLENYSSSPKDLFGFNFNHTSEKGFEEVTQSSETSAITTKTKYYIPSTLREITITGDFYKYGALGHLKNVTSISLPNVTKIAAQEVSYCSSLKNVSLGENLTHIGYYAFRECKELEEITLPNNCTYLGIGAFEGSGLKKVFLPSTNWELRKSSFPEETSIYIASLPFLGEEYLPQNTILTRFPDGDPDFIGFSFGGIHCKYDLGVMRVTNGLYNDNLSATTKDNTAEVPGGNGMYYFGSYDRQRTFTVNYAFDNLTEQQLRQWKQFCSNKNLEDLIFDELPYKVYTAKITGRPIMRYISFEENGKRIYKGDGTLEFTCYYPYAHTPNRNTKILENSVPGYRIDGKFLQNYNITIFPTKKLWMNGSGLTESATNTGYNPGDLPAHFLLKTADKITKGTTLTVGEASITINQNTPSKVFWDSRSGMVYCEDDTKKIPIQYSGNSIATIPVNTTGITISPSTAVLEYDYWYY